MIVTDKELREILRERCKQAGSQRAWAREHGAEEADVSRVLSGDRSFPPALLKALKVTEFGKTFEVIDK